MSKKVRLGPSKVETMCEKRSVHRSIEFKVSLKLPEFSPCDACLTALPRKIMRFLNLYMALKFVDFGGD